MAPRLDRWHESTEGRIVALLRRRSRTVAELAEALFLSESAVRQHLAGLQRDGLVDVVGALPGTRKPFLSYGLTPQAERLFPKASGLLLRELLALLTERHGAVHVETLLADLGRRLAHAHRARLHALPVHERLLAVADLLGELGGLAELQEAEGRAVLQGYSCPFSEALPEHPELCTLALRFLEELTGLPVEERCDKGAGRCRFELAAT